ncbi:MATE family efflux transporter [Nocardioides pacificus]
MASSAPRLADRAVPDDGWQGAPGERRQLARGGAITLVGAMYAAVAGFALTLAVGRLFGAHLSGLFFGAVAVFMILNGAALLGSDTGMLRSLAANRAVHAHRDAWESVRAGLWPVLGWSLLLAGGLTWASADLARAFAPDDVELATGFLRVLAATLVLSAVGQACLNGTRSFGSLRPFVLLYQVWLPTSRLLLVVALWGAGDDGTLLLWSWALPLLTMDVVALAYVLLAARRGLRLPGAPARPRREVWAEVWRFNLPRGLASMFEIGIVWIDVIIVGLMLGPAAAGAYAAASRFITSGTMAMEALRVGTAPTLAASYSRGELDRVQGVYALSSVWLVLLSWPMFLALASFAPLAMGLVGEDFLVAATAMSVMALGILGYLALGNINSVLLMAGLSRVTAGNTAVSLTLNIVLNLVLIPVLGLTGAAIAWASALTVDSVLCVVRGRRAIGVVPPWRGVLLAGAAATAAFGVPGLVVRIVAEPSWGWFLAYAVVSMTVYVTLLRRWRVALQLDDLQDLMRRRR